MTGPGDHTLDDMLREERVLMAAKILPNDGPLDDAQRGEAMANFAGYCRLHGIKVTDVAHQLGKPKGTTIGELIKGTYREHSDNHIRRLNLWVEQHARRRAAALTDNFVTTTKVAKNMLAAAGLTLENNTMCLVYGPTGIGKSRCALALAEKYVGAVYLRIIAGAHHPKGLTHALAVALRVRTQSVGRRDHTYTTQLERVIATLRDSGRLLLIDEAHKLTDPAVELLRDIHDTCGGLPIMLIATRDLHERIVKDADPDRGQLYSRIEITRPLTQGHDISAGGPNSPLHTMEDIRALYNQPPIRLSPDATRYLLEVSNILGHGSLRRCRMLVQNAARLVRKRLSLGRGESVTLTVDDLQRVEYRLRGEATEREAVRARRHRAAAKTA